MFLIKTLIIGFMCVRPISMNYIINLFQTFSQGMSSGKCVVVDLNCVDMTINLQTWVMLRDFMTISPTSSEKVIRGSQAVSDFLNDMSDPSRIGEFEVSWWGIVRLMYDQSGQKKTS